MDFDGWELPAYCYVEWRKPDESEQVNGHVARSTRCKLNQAEIQECADQILNENWPCPSKHDGPSPTQTITDKEIENFLRQKGLNPEDASAVLLTIRDIRFLAEHYYRFSCYHWDEVEEYEIRTFLKVPLHVALGWNERQIKVVLSLGDMGVADGRKSIDVACFPTNYRPGEKEENRKNCKLIMESKRSSSELGREAIKLAKEYAKDLPGCEVVMASNGTATKRSRATKKVKDFLTNWARTSTLKPRDKQPLYSDKAGGALDVLSLLLPQT